MITEIEVKFVKVEHDTIRQKLIKLGATCVSPMRLMRRVIIETPELIRKNGYVRVRDEGDKTTITYKQFDELSVDGAKEIEVTVSDFQKTIDLFHELGLSYKSYQESKRETWSLNDTEIVLDVWPWLNEYIEIEGVNEKALRDTASMLGLNWDEAIFGDVMVAYRAQYPHLSDSDTVANLATVKFGDPLPEFLK